MSLERNPIGVKKIEFVGIPGDPKYAKQDLSLNLPVLGVTRLKELTREGYEDWLATNPREAEVMRGIFGNAVDPFMASGDFERAALLLHVLGRDEEIQTRILEQHPDFTSHGQISVWLCNVAFQFGTEEQSMRAADVRFRSMYEVSHSIEGLPGMAEKREIIFDAYMKRAQELFGNTEKVFFPEMVAVNALMILLEEGYNGFVAVMNAGVQVPLLADIIGVPAGYIRYTKEELLPPRWVHKPKELEGRNIMICEDDAATGTTLRTVLPYIQVLTPAHLGTVFTGGMRGFSSQAINTSVAMGIPGIEASHDILKDKERFALPGVMQRIDRYIELLEH